MKTTIENLTPELARVYLESNKCNRAHNNSHSSRIAEDIKAGLYKTTPEPIMFNTRGEMFDGQHRCHAVIKSGTTIQVSVARGCDDDVVFYINSNCKPRTVADTFHFDGSDHSREFARMVKKIWRVRALSAGTPTKSKISNAQAVDFLKSEERSMRRALESFSSTPGIMTREMAAAWFFLFGLTEKANQFIEGLQFGKNLSDGSPVLLLRNALIADASATRKMASEFREAIIIKAFNAFALGQTVKQLRWTPSAEKFPELINIP